MERLDKALVARKLVASRSQAESYIKLGLVSVNKQVVQKPGFFVRDKDQLAIAGEQYVSRAALKLASVATQFRLDFEGARVLDIGSSTGGFTDYVLQHGAAHVIAVDVGTNQLHPSLHNHPKIELHEKTDIRTFTTDKPIDFILADVSFISLRHILPAARKIAGASETLFVIMCKPQFEATPQQVNKGVIKNSAIRRDILKQFEAWLQQHGFMILDKSDSQVSGAKGNVERFYLLRKR